MEILRGIRTYSNLFSRATVVFIFCTCLFLVNISSSFPQPQVLPEYRVKAVFLYNFTQFVQWPESTLPGNNSPFIIGILGEDPFGPYLHEAVREEAYKNHPFIIKHFAKVEDIDNCHILFIGEKDRDEVKKILQKLQGKNMLTVGETNRFGQMGGIITFVKEKGKIKLKINQKSAENARLKISSKLLSLAEIVSYEEDNQ